MKLLIMQCSPASCHFFSYDNVYNRLCVTDRIGLCLASETFSDPRIIELSWVIRGQVLVSLSSCITVEI